MHWHKILINQASVLGMADQKKEEVKPLAPLTTPDSYRSDHVFHEKPFSSGQTTDRVFHGKPLGDKITFLRRRLVICCGCISAFLLILAVVLLVLSITVFHFRTPTVTITSAAFTRPLDLINNKTGDLRRDAAINATLLLAFSVKNPNVAPFKFQEGKTLLSHGGRIIGEGTSPAGKVPAKGTAGMNVTVDVKFGDLWKFPNSRGDWNSGSFDFDSNSTFSGKVKLVVRRTVTVNIYTVLKYNTSVQAFQGWSYMKHL